MPCSCGTRTKCVTKKCECQRLKKTCIKDCKCGLKVCENLNKSNTQIANKIISSSLLSEGYDSEENSLVTIPALLNYATLIENEKAKGISETTKKLRISVDKQKTNVLKFRNGIDLYTYKKEYEIENPHVDHIIENQIMSHAIHSAVDDLNVVNTYIEPIKKVINQNENYNVTSSKINQSKGQCIRAFFSDNRNKGYPLRAIVLEKECEKYIEPICNAMYNSYEFIDPNLRSLRNNNGLINGNYNYEKIADELANIVNALQLEPSDERLLRSRKK